MKGFGIKELASVISGAKILQMNADKLRYLIATDCGKTPDGCKPALCINDRNYIE